MGGAIGGILGGIGSLIGASQQAKAAERAAKMAQETALTGYNYLDSGAGAGANQQYIDNGTAANSSMAQLLGQAPITQDTQNGFNNYLNSTAYKWKLGQGTNAITSNAASKGLLNSGGTAKALQTYGQGLAGQQFNNYLGQLGAMSNQGQKQLGMITGAGSTGGYAAGPVANAITTAGAARAAGTTQAFGQFGNALSTFMAPPPPPPVPAGAIG